MQLRKGNKIKFWTDLWNRELNGEDDDRVEEMKELLVNIKPIKDKEDKWIWCLETLSQFSVKSCYMWLFENFAGVGAMEEEEAARIC